MAKFRGRIQWNANQVAKLENAIAAFNRQLDAWAASGNYTSLPVKADIGEIRSRITNRDQLARMVRKLEGAAKPSSQKAVTYAGETIPQWQRRQISAIKAATTRYNKGAAKVRNILYPGFAKMRKPAQIAATDGKNLREVPLMSDAELLGMSKKYKLPYDLTDDEYLQRLGEKVREHWQDEYGDEVKRITDRLSREGDPLAVRLLFESDLDPLRLDYNYFDSPDKTPFLARRRNIMQFWQSVERNFLDKERLDPRESLMKLRENDYTGRYTYV